MIEFTESSLTEDGHWVKIAKEDLEMLEKMQRGCNVFFSYFRDG